MFCLPCVTTLHNVVKLVRVPSSLCHDTEWSGVLLSPFVPPRVIIADGSETGTADSTHTVFVPTQHTLWYPHVSTYYTYFVCTENVMTTSQPHLS